MKLTFPLLTLSLLATASTLEAVKFDPATASDDQIAEKISLLHFKSESATNDQMWECIAGQRECLESIAKHKIKPHHDADFNNVLIASAIEGYKDLSQQKKNLKAALKFDPSKASAFEITTEINRLKTQITTSQVKEEQENYTSQIEMLTTVLSLKDGPGQDKQTSDAIKLSAIEHYNNLRSQKINIQNNKEEKKEEKKPENKPVGSLPNAPEITLNILIGDLMVDPKYESHGITWNYENGDVLAGELRGQKLNNKNHQVICKNKIPHLIQKADKDPLFAKLAKQDNGAFVGKYAVCYTIAGIQEPFFLILEK